MADARRVSSGPPGGAPHFAAHRPDHSPPELLSDDELARAIDSLRRKHRSALRMLVLATAARIGFYATIAVAGIGVLGLGPAPLVELMQGSRAVATTWDVFVWWFLILAFVSLGGAVAVQASRRRRRRAAGWRSRVEDLERRLAQAEREQKRRAPLE